MSKLTVAKIKSLIKNQKGKFNDGNGLYLVIPNSGKTYWMYKFTIHKRRREMTLGKYEELSLSDARTTLHQYKQMVSLGTDPIESRKQKIYADIQTIDDLFEDWIKEVQKRVKHPNIPERIYRKDIAPIIGKKAIDKVRALDVRQIIEKVAEDRPTVANDALSHCKQLFNHAIKLDLTLNNPAAPFNANDAGGIEKSRNRILDLDELKHVLSTFRENNDQFTRENYIAVILLVCLGVRKTELLAAKWSEFDFDKMQWNLPEDRSKTGRAICIPISKLLEPLFNELKVRAFSSEYLFPNRRASKRPYISPDTLNAAIAKQIKLNQLNHFTVHDLRRTCRSLLSKLAVPGHIAERCLNHKIRGVEGIYDQYDYFSERKEALNKIVNTVIKLTV